MVEYEHTTADDVNAALKRLIHILLFLFLSYGTIIMVPILIAYFRGGPLSNETFENIMFFFAMFGPFGLVNAAFYIFKRRQ